MKKNERGILTIEASIVLCIFTLFVLFLFNFARVYRAENMVSHATLQAADALALESYLRETSFTNDEQSVLFWANRLTGSTSISQDTFVSLRSADIPSLAKDKFAVAISDTSVGADAILDSLGVKDGLAGVDFSESKMDLYSNDVIVKASYKIELQFPVFGMTELTATKSAKAKTTGEILFALQVEPEEAFMGSTTGSGKYKYGTEVNISATENYGFDFVSWEDGNTENPRKVTVVDSEQYIAKFQRHNFGVNLFIQDATLPDGRIKGQNTFGKVVATCNGASSVGGNEYAYESTVHVHVEETPGYRFKYWTGSKVTDSGVENIYTEDKEMDVFINGTYDLTAVFEPCTYTVTVSTDCEAAKNSIGVRQYGNSDYAKSVTTEFGKQIELRANKIAGYTFRGWTKDGTQITQDLYKKLPLPVDGGNYVAVYEKDVTIKVIANGHGSVKIDANGKTSYTCSKGTAVKIVATPDSGYYFESWSDGGASEHWVTANSDATYTAKFSPYYTITVKSGGNGSVSGGGSTFKYNSTATLKATPSTGYHFVRWEKSTNNGQSYSSVSTSSSYKVTVTGNAMYRAIFAINVYKVTLNANGGSLKSQSSYSVNYNGSTGALPKPIRQGYRFNGWSGNGTTYGAGAKVTNVKGNITLVAQWSWCSRHVEGYCGVVHNFADGRSHHLSSHSYTHNTGAYYCEVCVECGTFISGTCGCSWNNNYNRSHLGAVHLCCTGNCKAYWERTFNYRVYNIHKELGYE